MIRAALVLAAAIVLAAAAPANAQRELEHVLGKPLVATDLAAGTITVRVIAGTVTKPVAGVKIVLEGDGKPRTQVTDAAGRATFTTAAKASVRATIAGTAIHTDPIDMPSDAGIRVMLSSVPPIADPADDDVSSLAGAGDDALFAIDGACHSNNPEKPKEPMLGKPVPKAIADKLGAALRGKPVLVNFAASFNCHFAAGERATLAARAAAKDIAVVVVTSDADPKDVRDCFGEHPPFSIVLDAPAANEAIGPLTHAMKIDAVPETFLVDAHGIARFHYVSVHDFGSASFAKCAASL